MTRVCSFAIGVLVGVTLELLGHAASVRAQPEVSTGASIAPERIVYQDTVVVHSTKLPLRLAEFPSSAAVISPQQIRHGTASSLQDVVRGVPGLNVYDLSGYGTGGQVESRGFASLGFTSHLRVLIDEIPINDLEGDRVDWNFLSLAQVDRVELLRGPMSFLYGNAAMAGVINLVTRNASAGMRPWAQVAGGSGRLGSGAGGASFAAERAEGSLSGAYQTADGIRHHSAAENWSGYGHMRTRMGSRWTGRVRLFAHRGIQDIPGPLVSPDWRDNPERAGTPQDFRDQVALNGSVELSSPVAERLDALVVLATDIRSLDARETVIPAGTLDRGSDARSLRAEARLHWRPPGLPLESVLFGGEVESGRLESRYYDRSQPDPNAPVGAGDALRTSGGIFALMENGRGEPWSLMWGARLDWLRSSLDDPTDGAPRGPHDDLSAFSPTLGINVKLPHSGHVYAYYAGSFKAPTLEQLYDRRPFAVDLDGPGPSPPFVLRLSSNVLQPQRGYHVESGARSRLWREVRGDVAVYYSRSTDEIGFDLANFRFSNIDKSIHFGVEVQLTGDLGGGVSGQISGTLTRARFDGGPHDGKQINGVPEQQFFGRMSVEHRLGGSVTVEGRYVRKQWLDEGNDHEAPPYGVLDLGFTQGLGRLEMFFSARNLADRRYAETGYLTLDEFGSDLPLYYPGAGRSLRAGLRLPVRAARAG